MNRLRIRQVIVTEGKYDATALAGLVDGLIITTGGFSIFSDEEKKRLIRKLGQQRGLLVLTDSDAAGFQIRNYIQQIAQGCEVKHAYIPSITGKEPRKSVPSKEGTLGVEGLPPHLLAEALERAGVTAETPRQHDRRLDFTDLYQLGISGSAASAKRRRELLRGLGLPQRLSKRALLEVLGSLYDYEELAAMLQKQEGEPDGLEPNE